MNSPTVPPEILAYYAQGREEQRLSLGHGPLEAERTRELLLRHLGSDRQVILDVGGGPGAYACWLAALGHTVHLIDASPLHVEQTRRASARQPECPLASVRLGDARDLDDPDTSADAVLLMGPLYHLTDRADRLRALREGWRVLRPDGLLFAVGVSRFASLLDGLCKGLLTDPEAARIVEEDLRSGQHRNPTSRDYFTTSFFHRPEELEHEVAEGGFGIVETVGIEGPGWIFGDVTQRWADSGWRQQLLRAARAVEREPSMLGVGAHIMTIGCRRDQRDAGV
jgi:SAM-dependent methyltransferase